MLPLLSILLLGVTWSYRVDPRGDTRSWLVTVLRVQMSTTLPCVFACVHNRRHCTDNYIVYN